MIIEHRYTIMKSVSLAEANPLLAEEWHPTKNGDLTPLTVAAHSNKKVWWLGKCGHEWEATVNNRISNHGCPECGKILAVRKRNENQILKKGSLLDNNPDLAKQWNNEKNGGLKPDNFLCSSNKRVWWICGYGHEWQASINSRNSGCGCPVCSGRLSDETNNFAIIHPELVDEWDEHNNTLPSDYRPMSMKKVFWKCRLCGNVWEASIYNRSKGIGCPKCGKKRSLITRKETQLNKKGSLIDTNPKIASQWNYIKNGDLLPSEFIGTTNKKVWWQCEKGHEWKTSIYARTHGSGCPYCNAEKQTSFPEQAVLFYISKFFITKNRAKIFGNEVDIFLENQNIAIEYDGMFYHSSEKALERENRKNTLLIKEGIKLFRIKESDTNKVDNNNITIIYFRYDDAYSQLTWAIKTLLHLLEINTVIDDIDLERDRSLIEKQYLSSEKTNSISVMYPNLLLEWDYEQNSNIKPELFSSQSKRKVSWICSSCGYKWVASIKNRVHGNGCPMCAHKIIIKGTNDFATKNPNAMLDWDFSKNVSINPSTIAPNANITVYWKCHLCGHEWKSTVNNISQGHGCYKCSKNKAAQKRIAAIIAKNGSFADKNPEIALEWDMCKNSPLLPTMVTCKSSREVWWICKKCNYSWKTHVYSRTTGHGCPKCAYLLKKCNNKTNEKQETR